MGARRTITQPGLPICSYLNSLRKSLHRSAPPSFYFDLNCLFLRNIALPTKYRDLWKHNCHKFGKVPGISRDFVGIAIQLSMRRVNANYCVVALGILIALLALVPRPDNPSTPYDESAGPVLLVHPNACSHSLKEPRPAIDSILSRRSAIPTGFCGEPEMPGFQPIGVRPLLQIDGNKPLRC